MSQTFQSKPQFEQDVKSRFGILPNFFRPHTDAAELVEHFWNFAKAVYLDNPLPSLFKERLFVYLSRFCTARYCIVRHAGFLLGYGHAAGDARAKAQTVQEVLVLLRYPAPSANDVQAAAAQLFALPAPLDVLPGAGDRHELALLHAAGAIFLSPNRSEQPRNALRHALGEQRSEWLLGLIAYVRTAHLWTVQHPEITVEDDMQNLLAQQEELAALLLAAEDPERMAIGENLYSELQSLRSEKEHRIGLMAAKTAFEERDIQKNKFIAMLGHELRNPVAAITAVSEMFQMVNTADSRLRNASDILHRQTKALARMLDDLLDVSTFAFGKVSITKSPLVIDDVLTNVLREFELQFKAKGLTLSVELSTKRAYVMADRARLVQVFENILSNASQFTEALGNISVKSRVEGRYVTVYFTDSGAGFEPEFARTMFEPFIQGPQDLGRRRGGLGLGLAIAKKIADLHEGSLEASSAGIGKGATFKFSLPVHTPEQGDEHAGTGDANARMRVLVIEDNRDFSQLFRDMLHIMGCDPEVASTAQAGLDIARKSAPHMIFCDIGLPGDMDGFAFARALRADPSLAHIPLVAVSGYTSTQDRQRALSAGFDRICPKPVKFADVNEALMDFSEGKRSGR